MKLQQHKSWNEIKTNDSWAIFKIMGEFVNGFERMSKIGPCVSIFGSSSERTERECLATIIQKVAPCSFETKSTNLSRTFE